jgi:hypothetical protein
MQKEADVSNLNQTGISAMLGCELHWIVKTKIAGKCS